LKSKFEIFNYSPFILYCTAPRQAFRRCLFALKLPVFHPSERARSSDALVLDLCKLTEGFSMKTIFVAINFIIGVLALVFGSIAVFGESPNPFAAAAVGVVVLGIAATCLWLVGKSAFSHAQPT
jgi:protein-S-isoprenylcysteine O-methyltransferase Ste14